MGKVVTKTKDRKPRLNSLGAVCRPRGNHVAHDRTECNPTTTQMVIGLSITIFYLAFPHSTEAHRQLEVSTPPTSMWRICTATTRFDNLWGRSKTLRFYRNKILTSHKIWSFPESKRLIHRTIQMRRGAIKSAV